MRGIDEVSLRLGHSSLDSENSNPQFGQDRPAVREVQGGQGDAAPAAALSGLLDPRQNPLRQIRCRPREGVGPIC